MDKNTKTLLIVGGVGLAGGLFWYFFFGPGATQSAATSTPSGSSSLPVSSTAAVPVTTSQYTPADEAAIANIEGWINSMTPGSAQQNHWLGVLNSNPSSNVIQLLNQCLTVFGTKGASLTASQQAFWNNIAAGY